MLVEDEHNLRDTFEQLKTTVLGFGKIGTTIKELVFRGEGAFVYVLTRGLDENFDIPNEVFRENSRTLLMEECPDVRVSVINILEEGDTVAC